MPRINVTKHLREMGFSNPRERREWVTKRKDEIAEYYKVYGWAKTREHFHLGVLSLKRIIGSLPPEREKEEMKFTFEDIILAAPNTAMLGQLMLDGITALVNELREELSEAKDAITKLQGEKEELRKQLKDMTENREKIMREYNEKILKKKVFGIDQTRHILVPKEGR